jgi:hypothetical protein
MEFNFSFQFLSSSTESGQHLDRSYYLLVPEDSSCKYGDAVCYTQCTSLLRRLFDIMLTKVCFIFCINFDS